MSEPVKLTAYQWLTSERPAAKEWQQEATRDAWNQVYDLAAAQSPRMRQIPLPQIPIERPPTTAKGKFFNIPAPKVAQGGKYFALPKREPAPATKFFVITKDGGNR